MAFVNNKTGKPARADQELIVFPGEDFGDPDGIGVIIYGDGRVSNRWGDGTAGLNDDARVASEDETEALDPDSRDLYVWKGNVNVASKPKAKTAKKAKSKSKGGSNMTSLRGIRG